MFHVPKIHLLFKTQVIATRDMTGVKEMPMPRERETMKLASQWGRMFESCPRIRDGRWFDWELRIAWLYFLSFLLFGVTGFMSFDQRNNHFMPNLDEKFASRSVLVGLCTVWVSLHIDQYGSAQSEDNEILLQNLRAIHCIHSTELLVPRRNIKELVRVIGLHQVDCLLEFVKIFTQNQSVFQTINKLDKIANVLSQSCNPVWVYFFHLWGERKGLSKI